MPGVRAGGSIVLRANGLRLAYALAILLTFLCPASSAFAEPEWSDRPLDLDRIRRLSLEELMAIDVTSLAGLPKEWFRTPAAIAVLTADDIRRSGLRSLPEILRLVPGMFVGHQTSSFWRAGPRGFTGASLPSPRSLVLIDGRIVYDPLFGGVFWDVQQPVVEEIERIEVIRGPGATLWGPNAVNGVINVITRRASETKGVIVTAGGGSDLRAFGTLRAGASLGSRSSIRAYASGFARDEMHAIGDGGAGDDWSLAQAGFRLDSEPDPRTSLLLESSLYASPTLGARRRVPVDGAHLRYEVLSGDDEVRGGHVLARLGRDLAGAGSLAAQAYLDRADRERIGGLEVDRITADVDLRHDLRWRRGQELLWGIGYRSTSDRTKPGGDIGLDPADRTIELWSGFLQNTSDFARDRLHVMLGSKLTRQTFTGFEAQPSARLWWTPNDSQMLWVALSRPIRLPTRIELDGRFVLGIVDPGILAGGPPTGTYVPLGVEGNRDLLSEHLLAYELGHRMRAGRSITLSTSLFWNEYDRLISVPPGQLGRFDNGGSGRSRGVDLSGSWRPVPQWFLQAGYAFTEVQHDGDVLRFEQGNTPRHLGQLRSSLALPGALELNLLAFYAGDLPQSHVGAYTRLDGGIVWDPSPRWSLGLWGQHLEQGRTRELGDEEVPRGFYVEASWRP